ncbi:hypothetical protein GCM10009547_01250 [Sporichthya brevicatena]|uniref:Uncharacterized protein n=1 Tax=Sporichthya brevicatena TaxID=171442 RepID=A0ABN1G3K6_9ACTN
MSESNRARGRRTLMRRTAVAGVIPVSIGAFLSATAPAADAANPAFNAAAAATGVQITETLPGFIGTSTPFDGGGPTAQAVLSSFEGGRGYATFPDPGGFLPTLPGLGAGLFSAGAAGLPPIPVPFEVPAYPLAVTTNSSTPEQEIGAGPYKLTSSTDSTSSESFASAGFQPAGLGNVALVTSRAAVNKQLDGSVVSTSTVVIQGLAVGPISFGEIRSVASQKLDPSGLVTPSSSMEMSGVKIGGLPVGLTDRGFTGTPGQGPQQINEAFAAFMAGTGHQVTVVAAQKTPTSITAPTIQITGPLELPGVTTGPGTYTINLGLATASLQGTQPTGAGSGDAGAGAVPVGVDGSAAPGSTLPVPGLDAAAGFLPSASLPDAAALPAQVPTQNFVPAVAGGDLSSAWDINGLYLMVVFGAAVAGASAVVIRRWG